MRILSVKHTSKVERRIGGLEMYHVIDALCRLLERRIGRLETPVARLHSGSIAIEYLTRKDFTSQV